MRLDGRTVWGKPPFDARGRRFWPIEGQPPAATVAARAREHNPPFNPLSHGIDVGGQNGGEHLPPLYGRGGGGGEKIFTEEGAFSSWRRGSR